MFRRVGFRLSGVYLRKEKDYAAYVESVDRAY